jgi:hypothetical protein
MTLSVNETGSMGYPAASRLGHDHFVPNLFEFNNHLLIQHYSLHSDGTVIPLKSVLHSQW